MEGSGGCRAAARSSQGIAAAAWPASRRLVATAPVENRRDVGRAEHDLPRADEGRCGARWVPCHTLLGNWSGCGAVGYNARVRENSIFPGHFVARSLSGAAPSLLALGLLLGCAEPTVSKSADPT